ncbi:hypothetical protein STSP2_02767 [Anaerohalosphaera lusitana]|uniref:Fimbrial assembly protein (PilN) n=1 Tax=Anaerohalosphaera lusitana TaxID=1936003 RepID=A0A1U9NPA9_9BACT|nr:PilN domain-containing protein [Anaerohalosphaera lusitana]AQT69574.1 hypothetical protein STSP2_02767 [Anaerohalosphaera lusitana]
MANIDFVPTDYIEQKESSRANLLCLVLFAAIMGGVIATFSIIKVRQKAVSADLEEINSKLVTAQKQIAQLEEISTKKKSMMKTAVMTAELIEPVPKSVLLACLTNNLPSSVSLLELEVEAEEVTVKQAASAKESKTQYQKAAKKAKAKAKTIVKKVINNKLEITGVAPSDIEVANYIASLTDSILLDRVGLVESKEYQLDGINYRQFRLNARIKPDLKLSKEDIDTIRLKKNGVI